MNTNHPYYLISKSKRAEIIHIKNGQTTLPKVPGAAYHRFSTMDEVLKASEGFHLCDLEHSEPARIQIGRPVPDPEPALETIPTTDGHLIVCPHCHKYHLILKRGTDHSNYWSCKRCGITFQDENGTPFVPKCPSCKDTFLIRKGRKHDKDESASSGTYHSHSRDEYFWVCFNADHCHAKFQDHEGRPYVVECPQCHKGYLMRKKGPYGYFWACSRYQDTDSPCKAKFSDRAGTPRIPDRATHAR